LLRLKLCLRPAIKIFSGTVPIFGSAPGVLKFILVLELNYCLNSGKGKNSRNILFGMSKASLM
jgi:hypothetical protein